MDQTQVLQLRNVFSVSSIKVYLILEHYVMTYVDYLRQVSDFFQYSSLLCNNNKTENG